MLFGLLERLKFDHLLTNDSCSKGGWMHKVDKESKLKSVIKLEIELHLGDDLVHHLHYAEYDPIG